MLRSRRGFTLIELLVVIAIIGILAAMLFPVFAKAREAARKTQCLANVKNIAIAFNMYMTDYDRFPPGHTDQAAVAAFQANAPLGQYCSAEKTSSQFYRANPYLRWAVVLDEYVKNRQVWECPSAQRVGRPSWIIPQLTNPWYQYVLDNASVWGHGGTICTVSASEAGNGNCVPAWPSGWGGAITDSIAQMNACDEPDDTSMKIAIGVTSYNFGLNLSSIGDSARFVVCADNAAGGEELMSPWHIAFVTYDPINVLDLSDADAEKFWNDPSFRKRYTPHMGGLNVGLADGHAKWWPAETFVSAGPTCNVADDGGLSPGKHTPENGLLGLCPTNDTQ